MLIKKPYAFLIKHFRLIHGVLLFFAAFLGKKTLDIYDFYKSYVNMHTYVKTGTLAKTYVTPLMYIICILSLLVCLIILYILSLKNKNKKLYIFSVIFYIALFIFFISMAVAFKALDKSSFTVETVRVYRDIAFIFLFPQLIIIFLMFGRTIGFNIKQFDFKRDLEEMNIELSDSEEVELTFGSDSYKYARGFRKILRLSKYFILENRLFVIIVSSALIFGISLLIFSKLNIYSDKYYEQAEFVANGLTFDINESYITEVDKNNLIIKKDKLYLLVKTSIKNKTAKKISVNRETIRLKVKDDLLYPDMSLSDKFMDLGSIYRTNVIESGLEYDCYVVFELNKDDLESEYIVKVLTNTTQGYKEKIIKPIDLDEQNDNTHKTIPNVVDLSNSLLGNSSVQVNSYAISEKFMEKYTYVFDGEKKSGVYTILPDTLSSGKNVIMKIDSTITIQEDVHMAKYIKLPSDLYKYYGFVSYRANGVSKEVKITPKDVLFEKEKYTYLEIEKDIMNADKIDLVLLIRGQKYTFILK